MKKVFKLEDLDCANCARKMEDGIKKIDGVTDASVNFLAQKLTLEADDDRFDAILKEVIKPAKDRARLYGDCKMTRKQRKNLYRIIAAAVLLVAATLADVFLLPSGGKMGDTEAGNISCPVFCDRI